MMTKILLVVLCAALALPDIAQAQPTTSPETIVDLCERTPMCMLHVERARELISAGKHEAAVAEYRTAYDTAPVAWLLYNLARRLHIAGRLSEAADVYQRYLDAGTNEKSEQRQKAHDYLLRLRPMKSESKPAEAKQLSSPPVQPAQVTFKPALPTVGFPLRRTDDVTPVYKKGWLWTLLGVTAVSTAIAVGIGVYANTGPDPTGSFSLRPFAN